MAVGDAASAFDLLSSAGIYKALMTGRLAARTTAGQQTHEPYQTHIRDDYRAYLDMRAQLYDTEQRWADQPFWQLRRKTPAPA